MTRSGRTAALFEIIDLVLFEFLISHSSLPLKNMYTRSIPFPAAGQGYTRRELDMFFSTIRLWLRGSSSRSGAAGRKLGSSSAAGAEPTRASGRFPHRYAPFPTSQIRIALGRAKPTPVPPARAASRIPGRPTAPAAIPLSGPLAPTSPNMPMTARRSSVLHDVERYPGAFGESGATGRG
jgi:hypothetical protein